MDGASHPSGRTIDIELGGQEIITIDLDTLDTVDELLDLLSDPQCKAKAWVWTVVATEFWRRGSLEAAEKVATAAIPVFTAQENTTALGPIYSLLANIKIAHASKAPKVILNDARQDIMRDTLTKGDYYKEAATFLNSGASVGYNEHLAFLTRGIHQLATRAMADAMASFNGVLEEKPTNLIALMGKGRIQYAQRNYTEALKTFRRVLELNPRCLPDPRIGIGLCLWALGHREKAKAAWQRSLVVNPDEWPAQLLLGLEALNASKNETQSEAERTKSYTSGTKMVERAFKTNQKSAAAANALCELFLRKGSYDRALKLAERTIQFADTLTVLTEGYIRAGRVSHAEGSLPYATKYYSSATEGQPKHVIGAIGLAQMQMQNDEMAAAIHTLDRLLQAPNPQTSVEATVMLASLRAYPRPGVSSSDVAQERAKARDLFDRVVKVIEVEDARANGHGPSRVSRSIGNDVDMHAEIARLWQGENLDRVGRSLKEALRLSEAAGQGQADPRLLNNLGVLKQFDGRFGEAREMYEAALTCVTTLTSGDAEGMSTSILYNLARVYEDEGRDDLAKDAYEKLLLRHPEYVDAKVRQAHMLTSLNRHNEAHDLLKQALAAQGSNLNVRAYYTYFLIQANMSKVAKEFVYATLKDHDKHDVYSLCASGWIMYHQSRESRDTSTKGTDERKRGFQRSTEFYEKALQLDPCCAFAAQGLAIVTAEDALGTLGGALAPAPGAAAGGASGAVSAAEEMQKRLKNAREALDVFAKVRESLSDGSVYFNMGHCYYACDEFDRAIESYETASTRFYKGQNVPVLLCLCRSWYAKATKDQSFPAMSTALRYAQMALHIQSNDKAVMYNIAMIQQKSVEMLFGLPTNKRTLKDLKRAIEHGNNAQKLFASLAADKAAAVPYSRDLADQRRRYGDIMLRKSEEHLATQKQVEADIQAKMDSARQKRQEERDRLEALEREKMEALKKDAEKLAEERRVAREQALEWTREVRMESDEEKERKPKKARKQKADGSGDEAEPPKKKRRGKLKRGGGGGEQEDGADGEAEPAAIFSDEDDAERPKKRVTKKRVIRDDDDDEAAAGPRKKQFKSKEMLSDTDDEMP
ncbi:RNA polymerase II-associated protein [Roridomyces roridus]|uniref:RNA polymerase II-associated protein n=1 Tax=Roridomyces roridus TaxID=1738132 RepID=A0AAD7CED4_9AGAR|nr:RNA polymerase II-associated protein [Roridomyces roridus]